MPQELIDRFTSEFSTTEKPIGEKFRFSKHFRNIDPEYFIENVTAEIRRDLSGDLRKYEIYLAEVWIEEKTNHRLEAVFFRKDTKTHKKLFCDYEERYMLRDRRKEHFIKGRNAATPSLITTTN